MTTETKELSQVTRQPSDMAMGVFSSVSMYSDYHRIATQLASSTLIPKEFQGSPPNVMIALNMASRMNADPLQIMQSMYIVHGKPSFSSSFIAGIIEQSGKFTSLTYEMVGKPGTDEYGCRVVTKLKATGEEIKGPLVDVKMAKAEGWWSKSGSKWPNMTEVMLRYRAVAFFGRLYAGSILLGMQTYEELQDIKDINPEPGQAPMTKADIKDALTGDSQVIDMDAEATKPEEVIEPAAEAHPEHAQPQEKPGKEAPKPEATNSVAPDSAKGDAENPYTADEILNIIEKSSSIDTVNDALSCLSGFDQADKKRIMKAAADKNKQLAAGKSK